MPETVTPTTVESTSGAPGPALLREYTMALVDGAREAGKLAESSMTVALYGFAFILVVLAMFFKVDVLPGSLATEEFVAVLAMALALLLIATGLRVYAFRVETELIVSQRKFGEKVFDSGSHLADMGMKMATGQDQDGHATEKETARREV